MRVGIIGSGQLAQMLIQSGKPLGVEFTVFTTQVNKTTEGLADHIVSALEVGPKLDEFVDQCDVITFENENLPVELLESIEKKKPIYPSLLSLATAQDRLKEKTLFEQLSISTNRFMPVNSKADLLEATKVLGFPCVLKSRRNGYDGKQQVVVKNPEMMSKIDEMLLYDSIMESFVAFDREVSIIAVCRRNRETVFYDLCENQHEQGILRQTQNKPNDSLVEQAKEIVCRLITHFDYVGTIALEFFVKDGQLLANEIAPRVHNSGHWTIEGAKTSQFENHIRAICGLPLGDTASVGECTMTNCIGTLPNPPSLPEGVILHDYLKDPRPGRKLGHVTRIE